MKYFKALLSASWSGNPVAWPHKGPQRLSSHQNDCDAFQISNIDHAKVRTWPVLCDRAPSRTFSSRTSPPSISALNSLFCPAMSSWRLLHAAGGDRSFGFIGVMGFSPRILDFCAGTVDTCDQKIPSKDSPLPQTYSLDYVCVWPTRSRGTGSILYRAVRPTER